MISITKETPTYIKWNFTGKIPLKVRRSNRLKTDYIPEKEGAGSVVLEKYDWGWNIELISAVPIGIGIGTLLLKAVRERFPTETLHYCAITEESKRFFEKHGGKDGVLPPS